jgi:alginate O-acetyltransferase complex protein AlgI
MTLTAIGLMIAAALGSWLFRTRRADALLVFSIIALFGLQMSSDAGSVVLPVAGLILIVGVWWIVAGSAEPIAAPDVRTLALIGGAAVLMSVVFGGVNVLPVLAAVGVAIVGVSAVSSLNSIAPESDMVRKRFAVAYIVLIVLLLAVLKFFPAQQAITARIGFSPNLIGFSYIAFRLMHVLLDYRSGRIKTLNLRDFALYVLFFPAIPAGPIDRIEHFSKELALENRAENRLDSARIREAGTRIGWGVFKKFVLADSLYFLAMSPRLVEQNQHAATMWVMVYAYALYIFLDFSGYIDIAIGIGQLAGIRLPENFNRPYAQRNISAFWNNWHITLSTWFRNYFFTPLSRTLMATPLKANRNAIILIAQLSTMILIGLWHGAAINFVLWGAWHGIGLWMHRVITERPRVKAWDAFVAERPMLARIVHAGSVLATFHYVALGWIFFALPDLRLIGRAFGMLFGG